MARKDSAAELLGELALLVIAGIVFLIIKYWVVIVTCLCAGGFVWLFIYISKKSETTSIKRQKVFYKEKQNSIKEQKRRMIKYYIDEKQYSMTAPQLVRYILSMGYQEDIIKQVVAEILYKNKKNTYFSTMMDYLNGVYVEEQTIQDTDKEDISDEFEDEDGEIDEDFEEEDDLSDMPEKGSRIVKLKTCSYDDVLTLYGFDEEKADRLINDKKNGKMWYEMKNFARDFELEAHEVIKNEKNIIFPAKSRKAGQRGLKY